MFCRLRPVAIWVVLGTSLPACALRDPERAAKDEQLKSRTQENEAALGMWYRKRDSFQTDANSIVSQVILLRNYPGWRDMEEIIRAKSSIEFIEGKEVSLQKTQAAIEQWSKRTNTDGINLYNKYLDLATLSRTVAGQQILLLQEWGKIWGE